MTEPADSGGKNDKSPEKASEKTPPKQTDDPVDLEKERRDFKELMGFQAQEVDVADQEEVNEAELYKLNVDYRTVEVPLPNDQRDVGHRRWLQWIRGRVGMMISRNINPDGLLQAIASDYGDSLIEKIFEVDGFALNISGHLKRDYSNEEQPAFMYECFFRHNKRFHIPFKWNNVTDLPPEISAAVQLSPRFGLIADKNTIVMAGILSIDLKNAKEAEEVEQIVRKGVEEIGPIFMKTVLGSTALKKEFFPHASDFVHFKAREKLIEAEFAPPMDTDLAPRSISPNSAYIEVQKRMGDANARLRSASSDVGIDQRPTRGLSEEPVGDGKEGIRRIRQTSRRNYRRQRDLRSRSKSQEDQRSGQKSKRSRESPQQKRTRRRSRSTSKNRTTRRSRSRSKRGSPSYAPMNRRSRRSSSRARNRRRRSGSRDRRSRPVPDEDYEEWRKKMMAEQEQRRRERALKEIKDAAGDKPIIFDYRAPGDKEKARNKSEEGGPARRVSDDLSNIPPLIVERKPLFPPASERTFDAKSVEREDPFYVGGADEGYVRLRTSGPRLIPKKLVAENQSGIEERILFLVEEIARKQYKDRVEPERPCGKLGTGFFSAPGTSTHDVLLIKDYEHGDDDKTVYDRYLKLTDFEIKDHIHEPTEWAPKPRVEQIYMPSVLEVKERGLPPVVNVPNPAGSGPSMSNGPEPIRHPCGPDIYLGTSRAVPGMVQSQGYQGIAEAPGFPGRPSGPSTQPEMQSHFNGPVPARSSVPSGSFNGPMRLPQDNGGCVRPLRHPGGFNGPDQRGAFRAPQQQARFSGPRFDTPQQFGINRPQQETRFSRPQQPGDFVRSQQPESLNGPQGFFRGSHPGNFMNGQQQAAGFGEPQQQADFDRPQGHGNFGGHTQQIGFQNSPQQQHGGFSGQQGIGPTSADNFGQGPIPNEFGSNIKLEPPGNFAAPGGDQNSGENSQGFNGPAQFRGRGRGRGDFGDRGRGNFNRRRGVERGGFHPRGGPSPRSEKGSLTPRGPSFRGGRGSDVRGGAPSAPRGALQQFAARVDAPPQLNPTYSAVQQAGPGQNFMQRNIIQQDLPLRNAGLSNNPHLATAMSPYGELFEEPPFPPNANAQSQQAPFQVRGGGFSQPSANDFSSDHRQEPAGTFSPAQPANNPPMSRDQDQRLPSWSRQSQHTENPLARSEQFHIDYHKPFEEQFNTGNSRGNSAMPPPPPPNRPAQLSSTMNTRPGGADNQLQSPAESSSGWPGNHNPRPVYNAFVRAPAPPGPPSNEHWNQSQERLPVPVKVKSEPEEKPIGGFGSGFRRFDVKSEPEQPSNSGFGGGFRSFGSSQRNASNTPVSRADRPSQQASSSENPLRPPLPPPSWATGPSHSAQPATPQEPPVPRPAFPSQHPVQSRVPLNGPRPPPPPASPNQPMMNPGAAAPRPPQPRQPTPDSRPPAPPPPPPPPESGGYRVVQQPPRQPAPTSSMPSTSFSSAPVSYSTAPRMPSPQAGDRYPSNYSGPMTFSGRNSILNPPAGAGSMSASSAGAPRSSAPTQSATSVSMPTPLNALPVRVPTAMSQGGPRAPGFSEQPPLINQYGTPQPRSVPSSKPRFLLEAFAAQLKTGPSGPVMNDEYIPRYRHRASDGPPSNVYNNRKT